MADRIKGITIEIGGDTTGLGKALSGVNSEIRNTQSQLKDVERLLKLDPSNTELLRQKQKLLADAVKETKDKLETLKEANRQAAASASNYDAWKEKYDPIKTKIDETKKKLNELKEQSKEADEQLEHGEISQEKYDTLQNEIKETSKELQTLQKSAKEVSDEFGNPISPEQYDALQREIIETEERLKSLENQATSSNKALQQIGAAGEKFGEIGEKITDAGKALLPITAAVTGVGAAAIKMTADFDEAMSNVKALSGATDEELQKLRETALEMGESTAFSASEAADALGYMALAGWDSEKSIAALPGVLNLAAASGMDLAAASDMVTDYLSAFGMEAEQAAYLSDMMAYAQANSNTSATQLGEAYKNCAANLHASGQDVETVTSLLEAMANQGMKGSEAGTALAAVMRDITQKMKKGSIQIGKTSVAVQDSEGNFRDLTDILRDVEAATEGMGSAEKAAALSATFTADSTKGLNQIFTEGVDVIAGYEEALRSAGGTAEEQASTKLDNLNGQLALLKSALEGAAIAIGDTLMPKVKVLVAEVQEWVGWFNSLDQAQKEMIVTIGLVVAAIGPLLIILGQVATGIGSILTLISQISPLLSALGGPGGALLITAASATALGAAFIIAKDNTIDYYEEAAKLTDMEQANKDKIDELLESYNNLSDTRKTAVSDISAQAEKENDLWGELQKLVDENGKVKEGYEDRAAFIVSTLSEALDQEINITDGVIQNYKDLQSEIDSLIEKKRAEATLNAYQAEYSEAISNTKQAQNELAAATANAKDATDNYNEAVEKQKSLQTEYNDLMRQYEADGTNDAIRQQLYDLQDQMIVNGETIDGLKAHMDENNQTMETARQVLESYNTAVANYEGVAAAVISGDQAKISESLTLLTNDFQTAETSTRESLEAQCETYRVKLAEAREAVKQGAPGITEEYVAELVRLELNSRQELAKVPEAASQTAMDAAGAVNGKSAETEGAGNDFASGFVKGIMSGAARIAESARQMANAGVNASKDALDSHSPSKVTHDIGLDYDAGFAEGIADGTGQVIESVNVVTDAALSALDAQLQTSSAATQTYQSSMALSWSTWASTLLTTITNTLSNLNLNTSTQLASLQSLFQTETEVVQTDWDTKWTTIENKHKATMEKIKHLAAQTLQTVRMLNRTEVTAIKTDSITITNEMVTGVGEELKRLEPTVRNGYEPAINYIKGLIPQARGWSHDMMDEFIAGIRDKMDELEDACRDVADTVSDYMHFTRPEKGPLRYYEEWMPHMMQGLAKGIEENRSLITEQMKGLAADMLSVIQNAGSAKPVINFSNRSVLVLDGKEIAETVDTYLGEVYG